MRERSGRQDVPQRSGPNGLARRASAANATNESGGGAEIAGGVAAEKRLPSSGISAMIREDSRLSAIERVGIYADMYFYSLLDAIREDFPATFRVIGAVNFHNLVTGYLVEYPPARPSITEASRHLAEFAGNSQWLGNWPFVTDLIRLERALIEVFLGPDAEPLGLDELHRTPPQEWSSLRIGAHPAIQLLDCGWRVDESLRALDQERLSAPRREPRSILVFRKNCDVNYRALDDIEGKALGMVRHGDDLKAVCEEVATETSESATPGLMNRMLSRWLADGVIVRA